MRHRAARLEQALRDIIEAEARLPDTHRNGFTHQVKMLAEKALEKP